MSRYAGSDGLTYPDSDVLKNKLGLRVQAELDAFEADATAIRLFELACKPLQGSFDLPHLQALHRHLFQDVYEWAGDLRTVDISKGDSRFANWAHIGGYLGRVLSQLPQENFLRGCPPEDAIRRLAHYMGEINAVHPFREGNGRVQRAFCSQLAEQAGYFIDFDGVERGEMYAAMIASFHGDPMPLETLLARVTSVVE